MAEKEHYAFIPKRTLISEEFKVLTVQARFLYVVFVAERVGCDLPFSFPYKMIRETTRFRYGTTSKSIKELEKAGFLEYNHGGLERNTNKYTLAPSWLEL